MAARDPAVFNRLPGEDEQMYFERLQVLGREINEELEGVSHVNNRLLREMKSLNTERTVFLCLAALAVLALLFSLVALALLPGKNIVNEQAAEIAQLKKDIGVLRGAKKETDDELATCKNKSSAAQSSAKQDPELERVHKALDICLSKLPKPPVPASAQRKNQRKGVTKLPTVQGFDHGPSLPCEDVLCRTAPSAPSSSPSQKHSCNVHDKSGKILADFLDASKNPKGIVVTEGSQCRDERRMFVADLKKKGYFEVGSEDY